MKNLVTTFKVEKNKKYGDWRVVEYVNGEWENEYDGNWTEKEANFRLEDFNRYNNNAIGEAKWTENLKT